MNPSTSTSPDISTRPWAALGGLVFFAAYLVSLTFGEGPEGGDSNAAVAAMLEDPATRTRMLIGGLSFAVAALGLIPFLAALRSRIGSGRTQDVALLGGVMYAGLLLVTSGLLIGYPLGLATGELPEPVDPTVARVLSTTAMALLLIPGLWSASLLVAGTSLTAVRHGVFGRGLAITGFVAAPLLLLGIAWIPQMLVPLWVLAVTVSLLRNRRPVATTEHREREAVAV